MGASPEQLHQLGHHDCSLCKAEKKTKAEERLIKAIIENSNIIYSDYGASLLEAVRKERKKKHGGTKP